MQVFFSFLVIVVTISLVPELKLKEYVFCPFHSNMLIFYYTFVCHITYFSGLQDLELLRKCNGDYY